LKLVLTRFRSNVGRFWLFFSTYPLKKSPVFGVFLNETGGLLCVGHTSAVEFNGTTHAPLIRLSRKAVQSKDGGGAVAP
jgi:hypothetical protein